MANIRLLNANNVREIVFDKFKFDGIWAELLGAPETHGFWIIYGAEKHGKTWLGVTLLVYLSTLRKVLYVSAEEGISAHFQNTLNRVNPNPNSQTLLFSKYLTLEEIELILKRRNAPKIILIDNVTVYVDELKNGNVRRLQKQYPRTLWIWLAHEEKREPYTAQAKLIKKLSDIIFRVEGLRVSISGRIPKDTDFDIDTERAALYYGQRV